MNLFCEKWGNNQKWENKNVGGPHEANFLKLDCSKLKKTFGWKPIWNIEQAIEKTVAFSKIYRDNGNLEKCMNEQMQEFIMKGEQNV